MTVVNIVLDPQRLYYKSMSKYQLVQLLKERKCVKYAYSRTKPEIIETLIEMDKQFHHEKENGTIKEFVPKTRKELPIVLQPNKLR